MFIIYVKGKQMEKEFDEIFWSGNSFEDLYETLNFNKLDPKSKIFCAAISEWKKSKSNYQILNHFYYSWSSYRLC